MKKILGLGYLAFFVKQKKLEKFSSLVDTVKSFYSAFFA
ncbi:hypothetical protein LMHCC_2821 [Listeria monocytogenes HCC23]|uniref:Uncharacterized protein n=1 Tax=Listeria monocytogenes serotype 4a (strain M7) TaxID=1030009 RepID=A0A0E0V0G2_LISMM|nr:hypothetical protein LMHCC_2821 [Listeria monocytogenes HCC23]AEH93828.1 hypothetical protein LMM7_2823 [Listeria monocytogenes M7]